MEKRPLVILIAMIFGFTAAMVLAARYGGGTASNSGESGQSTATKKLRAKPGTERKNARAIVSSTAAKQSPSSGNGGHTRSEPLEVWGRPKLSEPSTSPKTEAERIAGEALNAASPEEGVEQILERLSEPGAEESPDVSRLYATLGTLYARREPLDLEAMRHAFERAVSAAATPGETEEAVYRQAKAMMQLGQDDLALRALTGAPPGDGPVTARGLELGVMRGMAFEKAGDTEKALAAYEETMESAVKGGENSSEAIASVFRQAGLRLARLHRRLGQTQEANQVARHMNAWLDR